MTDARNIDGRLYPPPHPDWGGFVEELFHYTSRYYGTTEAFLRGLSADDAFTMRGYRAENLGEAQRELLANVLAHAPGGDTAGAIAGIIGAVIAGSDQVDEAARVRFGSPDAAVRRPHLVEHHVSQHKTGRDEVDPLDPFLSLAERLLMPVAVHERHVEVSMHDLARHLDTLNTTLRTNLRNAIVELHRAGYLLRNHPHLTHAEAESIEQAPEADD
ncbi:MAG: endonuclease [Gammaproteobacteria bacterium]|nr:endonuclease [Gammaproteobacteria bacterium]